MQRIMLRVIMRVIKSVLLFAIKNMWLPLLSFFVVKIGINWWRFKKCLFCAEKIKEDAVFCKHCKNSL
jgi:hypothetical protein